MMKSSPFTDDELDRIEAQVGDRPEQRSPATCPAALATTARPVNQIITLPDSAPDGELTVGEYIDDYPYDVRAITDNRPFFWHFTPFSQVIQDIGSPIAGRRRRDRHR